MNDLTNLKAPGWQRIVSELTGAAPDDRMFLVRLLSVLGQVAGARTAVLYTVSTRDEAAQEPRPILAWPFPPGAADDQGRMVISPETLMDPARFEAQPIEHAGELKSAARAAAGSRQIMAFSLESRADMLYTGDAGQGTVVAVPITSGLPHESPSLPLQGVATLLLEPRSRAALQTTLALIEVLAGYGFMHAAHQALRRTRAASAALDLAARLIASINATAGFKGCTLQLVNDLSRQISVDRAAIGWVPENANAPRRGGAAGKRSIKLVALSDTENLDRRMAMAQKLEAAMEESLDQEQPVLYPPPPSSGPGSDAVLSQAITHAHRELAAGDVRLKAASFPLRITDAKGERLVGILTIETAGEGTIELSTIELIQATLDLVSPVLAVRYSDDRIIALRTWDWMLKTAAWAVGPRHTVWKAAGLAVMVTTLLLFLVHTTYRVGAKMELLPAERRVISVPYDGTIRAVPSQVEAGRPINAGDLLVQLDTSEMELSALEAEAQILQFEKAADEALNKGELADAAQNLAKADQSRARRDLLRHQVARSRITSPITGTIISGDLDDKIGAAVKVGDRLFEVADLSTMVVKARVDDRDIAMIKPGMTGQISPSSDPSFKLNFVVDRIVPLSQADEGQNGFEVRGTLTDKPPAWFSPGMEGQAKFNTESRSLAWIASRRIVNQLRVWLWW